MKISRSPFISLIFACFHLAVSSPTAAAAAPADTAAGYIRSSCGTTRFPDVCYQSLLSYANAVQQDPGRLARAAISVSLSDAIDVSVFIFNLTSEGDGGSDPRAAAALSDCVSVFEDAVDQMHRSLKQMQSLESAAEELMSEMSDVQTWMSAALTNEETCTDGFENVADAPEKTEVCGRVGKAKEVTSNALSLVNSFVSKVGMP